MLLFLIAYMFTTLWFTILKRPVSYHPAQFQLFWSYRRWFAGDTNLGNEIVMNIAMFVPFGFLFSSVLTFSGRRRFVFVVIFAAVFSLTIEIFQLFLMRGLFEWDDLISNTVGAGFGWALYMILERLLNEKYFSIMITFTGTAFMVVCFSVYISGRKAVGLESDDTSRAYCFQIDDVAVDGDILTMTGFAFRYEHPSGEFSLMLRPIKGDEVKLVTVCGAVRSDVNEYFKCDYDYTNTGFTASGSVNPAIEYEVVIKWPWSAPLSTGVYVSGDEFYYAAAASFESPDADGAADLKEILDNGTLRVYRPDYHCWVYQVENHLYWIVDSDFNFEDNGRTYIQYQMWTTQIQNLPKERLEHNYFWDNIGGYFEDYEIYGDYGSYRVMRRELPADYSITSIVTGYYKNGEWVWKNYFRPIYET